MASSMGRRAKWLSKTIDPRPVYTILIRKSRYEVSLQRPKHFTSTKHNRTATPLPTPHDTFHALFCYTVRRVACIDIMYTAISRGRSHWILRRCQRVPGGPALLAVSRQTHARFGGTLHGPVRSILGPRRGLEPALRYGLTSYVSFTDYTSITVYIFHPESRVA